MTKIYPVVFFTFKRNTTTTHFLELMRDAGVSKIYIYSDGPRNNVDKIATDLVRKSVMAFQSANPNIKIITNFSESNLGLKNNIIRGLGRVLAIEDAVIVLEDDCLPSTDFFLFTSQMLAKYKDDKRIMSINGTSVGGNFKYSYDFTKYAQCWGWATWKRAWKLYDPELLEFNQVVWNKLSKDLNLTPLLNWYFKSMLNIIKAGWIKTWDFQWSYSHFLNKGLAIVPSVNLIQNIGFDAMATNTKTKANVANMLSVPLTWPLSHPTTVVENKSISKVIETNFYQNPIAILGLIRQYVLWYWSKL